MISLLSDDGMLAVALIVGYLLGSIPFGLILSRAAGLGDIRKIGSGNIGATNVLRTGHKGLAAATLLLDAAKGAVAVLVGSALLGPWAPLVAGLGAFLGHIFPIWLGFKGGKGVATYIGVLAALSWLTVLAFCIVWLVVAGLTRYSSLAALTASAITPVLLWISGQETVAALFAVLTVLLYAKHAANIERLVTGREGKIGAKT
jgi:acyl phosphate:glycerol-3-phosphate acyltransferase